MFNKERYDWETDDELGQKLSAEVDSAIGSALSSLSDIACTYHNQMQENRGAFFSVQERITALCNDTSRYIG